MNANRMKYASTPTYGMQKRGLMKKNPARQTPEAPDFSKVPDPAAAMPSGTPYPSAQQPLFPQPPVMPQGGFMPSNPYFATGMPASRPAAQIPFASPSFIQPAAAVQPSFQGFSQESVRPVSQPLPLGNSAPSINTPVSGFSPRSQGYIPPNAQPSAAPRPAVQPAMMGGVPLAQVMPGYAPQGGMTPPQGAGYAPMQQQPFIPMQQPAPPSAQPAPEGPRQVMYNLRTPPSSPVRERAPLDADRLWSIFLFGLLPLLFIPCLFVPRTLDVIRYVFLGLCVLGLGGMWYRQMFTSVTRLIVSMVYVALCIVTIAMMMQGGRDALRTGATGPQQPSIQAGGAPDGSVPGMAAPTQTVAQPTPSPTISGPSEAERRLETFMALWKVNNTQEMVSLVQPSWASAQENPSTALFVVLANRTPEDFTIEDITGSDQDNSRTVTMTATINKNNGKDPSVYRFMVIMNKEGGEWYVDPNSLATNDELETSDDGNVVNDLSVAAATATPRTTVTPAPPADTLLYYNANGGSFFHLDAYCSSVRDEYLPLTGSFPYSELKSRMNELGLSPCLVCGAPTNTLPEE